MRRSIAFVCVLSLVLTFAVLPATAESCTPTGFMRDGTDLTAAVNNPTTTVSGLVDATGCDIGVYFGPEMQGTVAHAQISGARYFGVVSDGANLIVQDSDIDHIGDNPFTGAQHGVGIYYGNGATGRVVFSNITAYQKGGVVVTGADTNALILANVVTGLGPVDFIAQNGIQFSAGAGGAAMANTISNNFYTGESAGLVNPAGKYRPGWEWVSGGLLLYQAGDVHHSQNHFADNQMNVLNVP